MLPWNLRGCSGETQDAAGHLFESHHEIRRGITGKANDHPVFSVESLILPSGTAVNEGCHLYLPVTCGPSLFCGQGSIFALPSISTGSDDVRAALSQFGPLPAC